MKKLFALLSLFCLIGCGSEVSMSETDQLSDAEGGSLHLTIVDIETDLNKPTQIISTPAGQLWVAQLNGGENENGGQVVELDLESGDTTLLVDQLDKPTGIAILNDYLWIAIRDGLLRAPLDDLSSLEIVLEDMPFNGRSNGTLTASPDGELIYETSGRLVGGRPQPNSGQLWAMDPSTLETRVLATGLKGAYGHTFDSAGHLWTTEIGDDSVNGETPPDEINLVIEGEDYGWPRCYARQEIASDRGGSAETCQQTQPAAVVLPQRSTPTSIVESPFHENTLLVALWVDQTVIQVPMVVDGVQATGEPLPFLANFANPQHLLVHEDQLLIVDHTSGSILAVSNKTE